MLTNCIDRIHHSFYNEIILIRTVKCMFLAIDDALCGA